MQKFLPALKCDLICCCLQCVFKLQGNMPYFGSFYSKVFSAI